MTPMLCLLVALTAASPVSQPPEPPSVFSRSHTEFSLGYLGQWSDETHRGLELRAASTDSPVAGRIVAPLISAPFSGGVQSGLSAELRTVYRQLRITAGVRFPFANFRPSDTVQQVELDGVRHEVLVRSISLWDFRTGLGVELPFHHVTPYLDVLGDVQTLSTQLVVDGQPSQFRGSAFSLGGRLGLRYQTGHAFIALAGEAMALGATRFGGSLQLGFGF